MLFLSFHLSSCISYLFRSCWAVCLVKSWLTRCSFRFPHAATIKRRSGGGERTERCRKRRKDDRNAELITAPQRERKCVRGHLYMTSANILKIVLTPTSSLSAICLLFVLKFQIVLPPPPLSVRTLLQVGPQETMRIAYTCTRIFNDGRGYDKTCLNWTALQSFTSVGPHFTSLEAENGSKCRSPLRSSLTGI